jgi:hypothetical protein
MARSIFTRSGPGSASPCSWWRSRLDRLPEGAGLPDLLHRCDHLEGVFPAAGNPIGVQAPAKVVAGKERDQISQRNDSLLGAFVEAIPVPNVLFLPEEIHGASSKGNVLESLPEGDGYISDQVVRLGVLDDAVPDSHADRRSAIETGTIDLNRLPRK